MKLGKSKKSRRPGTDRRWTLLFIGDHGDVVTLKRFKAIVFGAGSLFLLAILSVIVLLFINKGTLTQNKDLQKRFKDSEKQIEKLRHEKEILMARLVLAESKVKDAPAGVQKNQNQVKAPERIADQLRADSKSGTTRAAQKKTPVSPTTPPKPPINATGDTEPHLSVAVENFEVSREKDTENLNAQFKIKNTSPELQRVAGHAVIVLKSDDLQKNKWLVIPSVGLAGEKPSGRRGRKFSIQRFRTMSFKSKAPIHSDQFQTAAVYIFTRNGRLLLEQDFSITLPPAPVRSAEPPAAQTADSGAEAPPGEVPASETEAPPSQVPAGEASSGDVPSDSSNSPPPVF